jgi:hypothetical protein
MTEILDTSTEIDIDLGIGSSPIDSIEVKEEVKKIPPNPIFEDMEEDEIEEEEFAKSPTQIRKEKEREFYQTLSGAEKEAWNEGWRKGSFFKGLNKDGTPRSEISAEEFLERRKQIAPINNERTRTLGREKAEAEERAAALERQVQELLKYNKTREEREMKSSRSVLDQQEDQAILEGDIERVRAIRAQRESLEREKFTFSEEPKQEANVFTPREQNIFKEWAAENIWFHRDLKLQAYASNMFNELHENNPRQSLIEKLEMVQEEIENRFGDKIGRTTRKPIRVDSGLRGMQSSQPQTLSYNEIPADAKAMCEGFIKKGKMSPEAAKKLRAEYVKEYSTN